MKHEALYRRDNVPYELDEVMFILWNLRHWGTDDRAILDIAKLVHRKPISIKRLSEV